MRIAFFLPEFADGGIERMALVLARSLHERGHSVDLVACSVDENFQSHIPAEVQLIDLKSTRALFSLPGLAWYFLTKKPDVTISAHYYANVIAVMARIIAKKPHMPLILTERTALKTLMQLDPRHISMRHVASMRWAYARASAVVANSHGTAQELAELLQWPVDKIRVIYNPAFDTRILTMAQEPVDCPWLINREVPVLVAAGRLSYQKDYSTLLRAFRLVRNRKPCKLVIVGKGPEREVLEGLCKELGLEAEVIFVGFSDNPFKYMARADLFVLSSRYEGLGNVLIEAQALGVPIVATNCSSGPSEILLNGVAGRLVKVGNAEELAEGILAILNDPGTAANYVEAGRNHLYRFTTDTCVRQYLELIHPEKY